VIVVCLGSSTRQSRTEKKKTGRRQRAATLSLPVLKKQSMTIINDWNKDVQTYLQVFQQGNARIFCPVSCPHCQHCTLHTHAVYFRNVFTETEQYRLPVQRFLCAACARTVSALPEFVERYESMTLHVQQLTFEAHDTGKSLEESALTMPPPTGPLSIRTVSRWQRKWNRLLQDFEAQLWSIILATDYSPTLPVGQERPKSIFKWLKHAWQTIWKNFDFVDLFQMVYRLRQSRTTG
jgi:transposase-like protein